MADMSPYERTRESETTSGMARSTMGTIGEQGSRAMERAQHTAEDTYYATRRFMEEQPLVAIAGLTAIAFMVGALWRMGSHRRRLGSDLVDRMTEYMQPQRSMRSMRRRGWY